MSNVELLAPINSFLHCSTPDKWIEEAKKPENFPLILCDHLGCELKAAQTAIFLLRKYAVDDESSDRLLQWIAPYEQYIYNHQRNSEQFLANRGKKGDFSNKLTLRDDVVEGDSLISKMLKLIKEELHHFEQVLEIMVTKNISYQNLKAGRYAKGLMKMVRTYEPAALVDKLIIGAYIEARSCERFAKLAPYLEPKIGQFYLSLLRSEARHYQDYLSLAQAVAKEDIDDRIKVIGEREAELITTVDGDFKFHSGMPFDG